VAEKGDFLLFVSVPGKGCGLLQRRVFVPRLAALMCRLIICHPESRLKIEPPCWEEALSTERVERRLAAILAADVAGYSRLMGQDEVGTFSRLRTHRRELIDPTVAEHKGRIVKTTGDGILIACAVAVQQGMGERNVATPDGQRIEFRVGINLGDVIVEDGDIHGDGVNIAARLESIAEPGGICISEDAFRQVQGKIQAEFTDLGEQSLKNIARKLRAYRVRLGTEAAPLAAALRLPDKPSIAVLPFQNMSADPEQEYFADGMVEDIITGLSRIRWLLVIARNSSFTYKGQAVDVKRVGHELGVRYVLEGSVRKAGSRVRVTTQLVEAETGTHVWAERYDRSLDDIFALQDEITLSTVGAIEPSLRDAEIERVKRKRPENLGAYDLVLQALPHAVAAMPEEAWVAVPLLERALTLEPDYGLAHGYLSLCFEVIFARGGFVDQEIGAAATRHAHAAITHGRDDATALALGAFTVALVEHDRRAAIEAFETALALSPSCSIAFMFGSTAMGIAGEAERAIKWGEQALRLSPFDRWVFGAYDGISLGHFMDRRYEDAANAARRAVQSNPGFSFPHTLLAASLAALGQVGEANAAAARVQALLPNFTIDRFCAGFAIPAALAVPLTEACHAAGLR
jgi:adenylate cyclase